MGKFGGHIGTNGGPEWDGFVQDADGVFTHVGASKKFRRSLGEIESELNLLSWNCNAEVVISEEKALVEVVCAAAGVKEPGFGPRRVEVDELGDFLEWEYTVHDPAALLSLSCPEAQIAFLPTTAAREVRAGKKHSTRNRGIAHG